MRCCAALRGAVLGGAVCCAMLCCAVRCYAVLCCAVLYIFHPSVGVDGESVAGLVVGWARKGRVDGARERGRGKGEGRNGPGLALFLGKMIQRLPRGGQGSVGITGDGGGGGGRR